MTAEGSDRNKVLTALQGIPLLAEHPSFAHFVPQLQKRFLNWPLELRIFARSPLSLRCCLRTLVLVLPVAPRASVLRPNPRQPESQE